jgi:predicted RNA-binding protein with PUA-like domain
MTPAKKKAPSSKKSPMKQTTALKKATKKILLPKTAARKAVPAKPVASKSPTAKLPPSSMTTDRHWLMKCEPDVFSIDDLFAAKNKTTLWDGVRNFTARNYMRDGMRVGDQILFYHSNAEPSGVAGVAEIAKSAYADPTAFDAKDSHYDAASDPSAPTWFAVDVRAVEKFSRVVTIADLKANSALDGLETTKRGSRLSVHPVSEAHFAQIVKMGRAG